LKVGRGSGAAVVVDHLLYVLGGTTGGYDSLRSIEQVSLAGDGTLSSGFSTSAITLANTRRSHTAIVLGKYVYVIGGDNYGDTLGTVERATMQ
jgi:hypothetical protein